MTQELYEDLNGRIVCFDHLGSYGQAAFTKNPKSRKQETPITEWYRLSKNDIEQVNNLMKSHGHEDYHVMCEDCAHAALVGKRKKEAN